MLSTKAPSFLSQPLTSHNEQPDAMNQTSIMSSEPSSGRPSKRCKRQETNTERDAAAAFVLRLPQTIHPASIVNAASASLGRPEEQFLTRSRQGASVKALAMDILGGDIAKGENADSLPTGCDSAKRSVPYIFQRQDYDEGMFVYSEPLVNDKEQSELIRSVSLLYNMAIDHVRYRKYAEARRYFELGLLKLAEGCEDPMAPLISVQLYHNLAYCFYCLGQNQEATKFYRAALKLVRDCDLGHWHLAASLNCVAVIQYHDESSGFADNALYFFQECLAAFRKFKGPSSKEVATVLNNIGRCHFAECSYDKAIEVYEEALPIRRSLLEDDSIDVAATICNMGQAHHQRNELDKAMACYEEFMAIAPAKLGENHRDVAAICKNMGDIHQTRGALNEARTMYEKALEQGRSTLGLHPDVATTLNTLANLCYKTRDYHQALKYHHEELGMQIATLDKNHPHIIVTLINIAQIHRHLNNFHAALIVYTDIYSLQIASHGPCSLERAKTLCNMGLMQYQLDLHSEAFDSYQEALRVQRDVYGLDNDNPCIATTLNSIGLVLFRQRMHRLAKSCFTDSLRIRTKVLGPDHPDVAVVWYNIATISLEMGEEDLAVQYYKEALRIERKSLGERHDDVILTLQHLGLVYQQTGQLDEALQYFSEALEVERLRKRKKNVVAIAKLLNLIGNIHLQQANIEEMMTCFTEASRVYRQYHSAQPPQAPPQQIESLVIAGYNFYGLSKLYPTCAQAA
jgi:tetratricopeptide (TPR) repeat protein